MGGQRVNYYNEIDPYAAQWIRNLIAAKLIPDGVVDERSIEDVTPADLAGFTQCHFFAGIAGWSLALRLAGIPDDYPIWTGSCPCQPFSAAGEGAGFDDPRHLWPAFHWLIAHCRPAVVVGEQVASKIADPWIDLVCDDMEALGFAFGAVAFQSASVGAPHLRDRTYWVGHASSTRSKTWIPESPKRHERNASLPNHGSCGRASAGLRSEGGGPNTLAFANCVADSNGFSSGGPGPVNGFWRDADWLAGRDGKWRPVEPGTPPLAVGLSARVGRLRAYGNAINPWQAAEFLKAALI